MDRVFQATELHLTSLSGPQKVSLRRNYEYPATGRSLLEADEDSREAMRLILASKGFEVVCPENPVHDFLTLAREEEFDAYLLDKVMPGITGKEICEQIRQFDSRTPIIFYSDAASL